MLICVDHITAYVAYVVLQHLCVSTTLLRIYLRACIDRHHREAQLVLQYPLSPVALAAVNALQQHGPTLGRVDV